MGRLQQKLRGDLTSSEKSCMASLLSCRPCPRASAVGCNARVNRTERSLRALRRRSAAAVARIAMVDSDAPRAPYRYRPSHIQAPDELRKAQVDQPFSKHGEGIRDSTEDALGLQIAPTSPC